MRTSTLLRIAAVLMLLYAVGHSMNAPWTPGESAADLAVIDAMRSNHFPVLGFTRSYWDFYVGFGWVIGVMQLFEAIVVWQLGTLAKTDARPFRPIIAAFFVAALINAILGWMYFFTIPIVMAVLITICLAFAFLKASSPHRERYRS